MIDLINKRCAHDGCLTRPTYGIPGHPTTHCARHKKPGMIKCPKKRCKLLGCLEIAIYGARVAQRCEQHKLPADFNLIERECGNCHLPEILNPAGLCGNCADFKRPTMRLAKQNEARDMLIANRLAPQEIDITVDGGACGRERPDFVYETPTHFLVVEVDENQHRGYTRECETTRMINISQSFGMPTIFIRFNPDRYKPPDGQTQWTKTNRFKTLRGWITHLLKPESAPTSPNEFLRVLYICYNGFSGQVTLQPIPIPGMGQRQPKVDAAPAAAPAPISEDIFIECMSEIFE